MHSLFKQRDTHNKGQLIMEALWLILFVCAFLATLSHLYEKGKIEIQNSQFIKKTRNEK